MTPEEAIKVLHRHPAYLDIQYASAVGVALVALEKQVPKKPRSDHKYTSEIGKIGYDHCSMCGTMVTRKYCPECGQRVDWTKEEV